MIGTNDHYDEGKALVTDRIKENISKRMHLKK